MMLKRFVEGEKVVQKHSGADRPHPALALLVNGNQQRQGLDQMRREAKQSLALPKRLAHEADFSVLQVTQPAMYQSRRPTGCTGGEIALVQQEHLQAAHRRIARNACAVDPSADDDRVKRSARDV